MARITRTLAAAATAGVVLAATGAAYGTTVQAAPSAPAAATALRWMKPKVMELDRADTFTDVAASGWGNIWAGGMANVEERLGNVPLWHWNGTKWARVLPPKAVDDRVADLTTGGAGNTWLLGAVGSGLYRRSGTTWVSAGARGDDVTAIGATGASDLFAAYPGGIRHYDGSTWTTAALPAKASVSAIRAWSRTNVWAVGVITTADRVSQPFTAHWDGTAWTRVATPKVDAGADGNLLTITDLAYIGKNDAFASGQLMTSESDYQAILLHWNGTRWTRVATPAAAETGLDDVAADGRGGLWAVSGDVNGVLHRTSAGTWSTYALPGDGHPSAWAMTRIPGTKRAIGAGQVEATASTWKPAIMLTN